MKPYSDGRRERDKHYPDARAECFRRAEGRCQVMALECEGRATDCHHIAGRGGPDPHRQENLLACCAPCHSRIHMEPAWSREQGYMRSRHDPVRPSRWVQTEDGAA